MIIPDDDVHELDEPGQDIVNDAEQTIARIDAATAEANAAREEGAQVLKAIERAHMTLAAKLGVPSPFSAPAVPVAPDPVEAPPAAIAEGPAPVEAAPAVTEAAPAPAVNAATEAPMLEPAVEAAPQPEAETPVAPPADA